MLCTLLAGIVVLSPAASQEAAGSTSTSTVIITEIMYNPASTESRGAAEWVEIANIGVQPVTLDQWRLADEDASAMQQWSPFGAVLQRSVTGFSSSVIGHVGGLARSERDSHGLRFDLNLQRFCRFVFEYELSVGFHFRLTSSRLRP